MDLIFLPSSGLFSEQQLGCSFSVIVSPFSILVTPFSQRKSQAHAQSGWIAGKLPASRGNRWSKSLARLQVSERPRGMEKAIRSPLPRRKKLLASLPDAPLPFPEGSFPKDEKWLRDFIKSMKKDDLGEPSAEELWQFNLALAALNITPDQLPEALRQNTAPKPESDTLSVYFAPQPGELMGAIRGRKLRFRAGPRDH